MSGLDVAVAIFVGFVLGVMSCAVAVLMQRIDEEESEGQE